MKFLEKIFGQKLFYYIVILVVGFIIYFAPGLKDLDQKDVGLIIIIISALGVLYEAKLRFYIKFKKSSHEFKLKEEEFIADYLEKKKIKYLYNKKISFGLKRITATFFLPEFDTYVIYWPKKHDYEERRKIAKEFKSTETPLIELYYDNIYNKSQLDWKFTERLLNSLKKERST